MTFCRLASEWLSLNALIAAAYASLWAAARMGAVSSARSELRLHYFAAAVAIAAAVALPFFPQTDFARPIARVWAARSAREFDRAVVSARRATRRDRLRGRLSRSRLDRSRRGARVGGLLRPWRLALGARSQRRSARAATFARRPARRRGRRAGVRKFIRIVFV